MDKVKRYHGFYRGVVRDNRDPNNQRRLKVEVPQINPGETTDWCWPVEPAGVHVTPPVKNQGVWVSFIGGDPEHPVWHGAFGTHQDATLPIAVTAVSKSTSLSSISSYIQTIDRNDGTKDIDLAATLVAIATALANHESRIHTLETTPDIDSDPDH